MRYDEKTRTFNSVSFAVLTLFSSGISMHALADLLQLLLGWNYHASLLVISAIVLAYVLKGGLSSAIYNEVLQFFMILLGIAPLAWIGLEAVGGWQGLMAKISTSKPEMMRLWQGTSGTANPLGVPWYGIMFGLGIVLSFGYWCTNFAEVQRALAARSMGAARRTPLIGAIPKMMFPAVVILPGIIAWVLSTNFVEGGYAIPLKDGSPNYNQVLPSMIFHYFPNGILGLALTALMASFMSGMAANVTAFNTVWTYDIYQTKFPGEKTDKDLLRMGRYATIGGVCLSIFCAYLVSNYNNIMSILQMVFGFINSPIFATFLLGMFTTRSNSRGAFWGLVTGTTAAIIFHGLSFATGNAPGFKGGWITPLIESPKEMSQGFWVASIAFSVTFLTNVVLSFTAPREKTDTQLVGLVYSLTPKQTDEAGGPWIAKPAVLGAIIIVVVTALNFIFW
jgi:SSS family solute:Na+ symporter